MLSKQTIFILYFFAVHSFLTAMDYNALFYKPRAIVRTFWDEAKKDWVTKIIRRYAQPQHTVSPSPDTHDTLTNYGTAAQDNQVPLSPFDYLLMLGTVHHDLPALSQLILHYKKVLIEDNSLCFEEKERTDALTVVETVLTMLPMLSCNGQHFELLSNCADIILHLQKMPHTAIDHNYAQLAHARLVYHANKYLQEEDPIAMQKSWQTCNELFSQTPSNCLAGIYSVIIPLFARAIPATPTTTEPALSLYEYLDMTLDQLETKVSQTTAQTALDLFHTELEQLAYHCCDVMQLRALRLLKLLSQAVGLENDAKKYTALLEKTNQRIEPPLHEDIIQTAIRLIMSDPKPEALENYLQSILDTYTDAPNRAAITQRLFALSIPVIINNNALPVLASLISYSVNESKTYPYTFDALMAAVLEYVEKDDASLDHRDILQTSKLMERSLKVSTSSHKALLEGYLLLKSLEKNNTPAITVDAYIVSCTRLYTLIKELLEQNFSMTLKPYAHRLSTKVKQFLIDATNSPLLKSSFEKQLILFEYAIQLQHPQARSLKAYAVLNQIEMNHQTIPLKKIHKLVAESIQTLKADGSVRALLLLGNIYLHGLEHDDKTVLITIDRAEGRKYIVQAFKTYPNDAKVCYSMGALLLLENPTDLNATIRFFTKALQKKVPYTTAFAQRGLLYAKQGKYQAAYADLNHFINIENIYSKKLSDPLDSLQAEVLWLAGICHYRLNPDCVDILIKNWSQVLRYKEHYTYINPHASPLVLEHTPQYIIPQLITKAKKCMEAKLIDQQTLDLCYQLFTLQKYTPTIIANDAVLFRNYALHHEHTDTLVCMISQKMGSESIGLLPIMSIYKLYQLSEMRLQKLVLSHDFLKDSMSTCAQQGILDAQWYSLCMDIPTLSKDAPVDAQSICSYLKQFYKPAEEIKKIDSDPYYPLSHKTLEHINTAGVLPILKNIADNFCIQQDMPGIDIKTDAIAYIVLQYALMHYNAYQDPYCSSDKKEQYFTTAMHCLRKILEHPGHNKVRKPALLLQTKLTQKMYNTIITMEGTDDASRAQLLRQGLQDKNSYPLFVLAALYMPKAGAVLSDAENVQKLANVQKFLALGQKYKTSLVKYSYEYYRVLVLESTITHLAKKQNIPTPQKKS